MPIPPLEIPGLLGSQLVEYVYDFLTELAMRRETSTATEVREFIANRAGLPLDDQDPLLVKVLAAVSERSFEETRTLITVLINPSDYPGWESDFSNFLHRHQLQNDEGDAEESIRTHREAVYSAYSLEARIQRWRSEDGLAIDYSDWQEHSQRLVDLQYTLNSSLSYARRFAPPAAPSAPYIGRCHDYSGLRLVAHSPTADGRSELRLECARDPQNHYWTLPL